MAADRQPSVRQSTPRQSTPREPALRQPTLREVSQLAGLSVTQTSRALNGHSDVSAESRNRAESAARKLGYVPNLEARRLKMPDTRSHSIGLVLVSSQRFSDPFLGDLLSTMVDEAAACGYELQLSAPLPDEDPTDSYARAIRSKRVDGFVVLRTMLDDPRVRFLSEYPFPFVTFGQPVAGQFAGQSAEHREGDDDSPVVAETDDCLQPAVDHLVELGHRRIGCLIEPPDYLIGARRAESFLRAMAARGLDVDDDLLVRSGFRDDTAYAAVQRCLENDDRPTAFVASNDLLALGAIRAAQAAGLEVPTDLSVVGFDNIDASQFSSPALTTLGYEHGTIGHHLVEQLLRAIGSEPGDRIEPILLKPHLVQRESTAPAPANSL